MEEENENSNINTKNKKKSRLIKIIYLGLILIIVQIIFLVAYRFARYKETYKGSASAEIAKMICEMNVIPNEKDEDNKPIINPYRNITVRNYDENNRVSEVNIKYTIQVIPKDDLEIPEYYWENSEGTKLQENSNLTGEFENGVKEEKEYKIVFINSGEKDINRKIEFKLTAVQAID